MLSSAGEKETLVDLGRRLASNPDAAKVIRGLQLALFVGVVAYLAHRLSAVGWSDVAGALPTSPLFYALFALRYFALPLSEIPAYELVWRRSLWRHFPAFLRKRVYNYSVLGYSGEAFFTLWARRRLDISDRDIVIGVKDNNLLSALASNLLTVALVAVLGATGALAAGFDALPGALYLFSAAFATALGLSFAVVTFRRKLINLPKGVMTKLVGFHSARALLVMALQAGMYAAALPDVPLLAWIIFIALQLVLSRIPFTPNQDIVYLTAALHLAPIVGAPDEAIAGMLVAEAGLSQALNFVFFILTAYLAKPGARQAPF